MKGVVILDFGSQYTQLIARRIREQGVYSVVYPYNKKREEFEIDPIAIILSGSPSSIYEENAPKPVAFVWEEEIPILGICYGLQILADKFSGNVAPSNKREYGRSQLHISLKDKLFEGMDNSVVWMSHGDKLDKLPQGFEIIGYTDNSPYAAIKHKEKPIYGVQFHPEVNHTEKSSLFFKNFIKHIVKTEPYWTPKSFIDETIKEIKEETKEGNVVGGLSGGVDSTVSAVLMHRAIGDRFTGIFVDTGLMRKNEAEEVKKTYDALGLNVIYVNAKEEFLSKLKGINDPEEKRKIIGHTFIEIFERESLKINNVKHLMQGTLYPDRIESVSVRGPSVTIKTHHNVGGLPEKMKLKLIEPLKDLFKDEVRKVGEELNIPHDFLWRHPFPGPGLAVRILGEIKEEYLSILKDADAIFIEELKKHDLYEKIWQAFAVFIPVKSVGVMGDLRTYQYVIGLRAVTSSDGMTADWYHIPYNVLQEISTKIINEIKGVNRVVYDISSKPPSTIEWE